MTLLRLRVYNKFREPAATLQDSDQSINCSNFVDI